MQNSSRWPLCPTFRYGVKGQKIWIISNNVKLQIVQGQRLNINNGCVPVISDDSSLVLYPAGGPAGSCILLVSSFFFFFLLLLLLSSGNTSFSHTSLHLILTKLAHSDRYLNHYSHIKDGGVRGHYGVTGVKKVIFTKNASSPSDYVASTRDFCICSSLTPSTKVMVLKNCQGSFGVTGVKSSFSQKRHQVLQIM